MVDVDKDRAEQLTKHAEKAKTACEEFAKRMFMLVSGQFTGDCTMQVWFKDGWIRRADFGSNGPLKEIENELKERS